MSRRPALPPPSPLDTSMSRGFPLLINKKPTEKKENRTHLPVNWTTRISSPHPLPPSAFPPAPPPRPTAPSGGKPNILVIFGDDIGLWNVAPIRGMIYPHRLDPRKVTHRPFAQQSSRGRRPSPGQSCFPRAFSRSACQAKEGLSEKPPPLPRHHRLKTLPYPRRSEFSGTSLKPKSVHPLTRRAIETIRAGGGKSAERRPTIGSSSSGAVSVSSRNCLARSAPRRHACLSRSSHWKTALRS